MNNRYEQDKLKKCYGLVREIQSCTHTNEIRGISLSKQISVFRGQTQARFILIRDIRYVTRTQAASQQIFFKAPGYENRGMDPDPEYIHKYTHNMTTIVDSFTISSSSW